MNKKRLINNIASISVVQIANYALPLISVPIISRIIGPVNFGIINYVFTFIAYFNVFIGYGFDLTATRKIAADSNNAQLRSRVFSETFQAQIFLFVISLCTFIMCIYAFPPLKQNKEVAIFSFMFCIGTLLTQNWLFIAMQDLPKVALFDFCSKLLFTVLILIIVRNQNDYVWQPLITSLVQIIISLSSFIWAIRRYKLKIIKVSFNEIIFLLRKEKTIFISLILINLYTTINIIILGIFQNSEKVGFYTGGQKLILIAYSVISLPLSHALFPFVGSAFADNFKKGISIVHKIIPLIVLLTGSAALLMLMLGPFLVRIFYGNQFEPSIAVFQLLVFIPMFVALNNIFGLQIMLNLKMDKLYLGITFVAAAFSVLFNITLIKMFGYKGAALSWILTEIAVAIVMYASLRFKGINPIDIKQFRFNAIKLQIIPLLKIK